MEQKKKRVKQYGRYVKCSGCSERIYVESEECKNNSTKIANKIIYECACGEETIIE